MGKLSFLAVAALMLVVRCTAQAEVPVVIDSQGWTITASPELGTLTASYQQLGLVLQNVRLGLQSEHGFLPLTRWSVEKSGQSSLTIHTVHPIAAWNFQIDPSGLEISSTFTGAMLTAEAPAPLNRIPARTLDPRGFPVDWLGTNEAMLAYGGEHSCPN